ncbi:MAG: hypothetical protein IT371_20640 [Deltaproteobacteria bacterium]|nr:hypothetical protein [Deltaproteobacteria bacterium]
MRSIQISSALLLALAPSLARATDVDDSAPAFGHAAPAKETSNSGLKRLLSLVRPKLKPLTELVAPHPRLGTTLALGQSLMARVQGVKDRLLGHGQGERLPPVQATVVASAMGSRRPMPDAPTKPAHQLDALVKALQALPYSQWRIPAREGRTPSTSGGATIHGADAELQPALWAASLTLTAQALHVGVRYCVPRSERSGAPEMDRIGGCTLATYGM